MPNSEGEQEKVGAWLGLLNLEIDMSAGMGGGAPLAIPAEETRRNSSRLRLDDPMRQVYMLPPITIEFENKHGQSSFR